MKKIEIIPAVLPKDYFELEEKVETIKGFTKRMQVDICDGQFVLSATWPYKKEDDTFEKLQKEEVGLPGWETIDYEFDLMVNRPEDIVESWIIAGANRLIIHVEAKGDIKSALEEINGAVEVGLAINIDTDISALEPYKDDISFVQCMGIDQIGFQGQSFDDQVLKKIKAVKKAYPNLAISVDGGVSMDNALSLIKAGADRLVIGSAIFGSNNPIDTLQTFKKLQGEIL